MIKFKYSISLVLLLTLSVLVDGNIIAVTNSDSNTIQGNLRFSIKISAAKLTVKLFEKTLTNEKMLASTITDSKGEFRLMYQNHSNSHGYTIILKVFDIQGRQIYESTPIINPARDLKYDIIIENQNKINKLHNIDIDKF